MYSKKDNTLSLLGGAVLGAVAMYLLDPESGSRRRQRIAETTGDAARGAGARLHPMMDRVGETARSVASTLAGSAGAIGSGIAEKYSHVRDGHPVQHLGDHVSDIAASVAEKFKSAGRRARDAASDVAASATSPRQWFAHEEPSHAGRYAATGIGTLLLGAGLMYFLDPTRGRMRRTRMCDKAASIVRRTGHTACQLGKDVRNRAKGCAHEARGMVSPAEPVTAETLLQRVRSEMGHVVSHANAIQVMTDNNGRVTLHGKVLASEADKMLSTIKGVAGVNEVINLLSVKETEQQMNEPQTASGATTRL